jgi:predicted ATPase
LSDLESLYSPEAVAAARDRFVVITGCSGGGKSSLLAELARRGEHVCAEPGRQVIREQNAIGGDAVPQHDAMKFLELTISRTMHQMIAAASSGGTHRIFFDRGIVDQVSGPVPPHFLRAAELCRFHENVFVVPPWPELFHNDEERKHSFEDARAHYEAQLKTYERFGYKLVMIPKVPVPARADFVLEKIASA